MAKSDLKLILIVDVICTGCTPHISTSPPPKRNGPTVVLLLILSINSAEYAGTIEDAPIIAAIATIANTARIGLDIII